MCLELYAHARVELWRNVSQKDVSEWYLQTEGIDGAGHHLEWIVCMKDEEQHIRHCFYALRVRDV